MPIDRFVVDFASEQAKLVIEIDGSQHARAIARDAARSRVIEARGYLILRFWNNEVIEAMDVVLDQIIRTLAQRSANPPLP
jgi:very-short-patch-repair endonuclease